MSIDTKLPFGPFKDALSTVLGAIFAVLFTSMLAGTIPVFIMGGEHVRSLADLMFIFPLAWIGHWIISGIQLWGIIFVALQIIAFHSLIYGSREPLFILALIFLNQLFVSTVVLMTVCDTEEFYRLLCGGIVCLGLMGVWLWKMHAKGYSKVTI